MPWPALAGGSRRTATRGPCWLVHGDVHQLNALQNDGGFKLIDPDGLLAEA
jgi:streptomycin 6-kinase